MNMQDTGLVMTPMHSGDIAHKCIQQLYACTYQIYMHVLNYSHVPTWDCFMPCVKIIFWGEISTQSMVKCSESVCFAMSACIGTQTSAAVSCSVDIEIKAACRKCVHIPERTILWMESSMSMVGTGEGRL